jgi:hypothetical protein
MNENALYPEAVEALPAYEEDFDETIKEIDALSDSHGPETDPDLYAITSRLRNALVLFEQIQEINLAILRAQVRENRDRLERLEDSVRGLRRELKGDRAELWEAIGEISRQAEPADRVQPPKRRGPL